MLVHSFNGLEQGYKDLVDRFASEGFVVLAVGWQTFEKTPTDAVMAALMRDAIAFLRARDDVDGSRIGLTGFCAGGRYTMLFLPTIPDFEAGVAWYGFPNAGGREGLPHGFMVQGGQLWRSSIADNAFQEMVSFFKRTLK